MPIVRNYADRAELCRCHCSVPMMPSRCTKRVSEVRRKTRVFTSGDACDIRSPYRTERTGGMLQTKLLDIIVLELLDVRCATHLRARLANMHLVQHCNVLAARRLRSRKAAALRLPSVCRARKQRKAAWIQVVAVRCRLLRHSRAEERRTMGNSRIGIQRVCVQPICRKKGIKY